MYAYAKVNVHVGLFVYGYVCMFVCMHAHTQVCMYAGMHACMHVCTSACVCVCARILFVDSALAWDRIQRNFVIAIGLDLSLD